MILSEFSNSFARNVNMGQYFPDVIVSEECAENPFEYMQNVYYESMLIDSTINMNILAEEYAYLKETGLDLITESDSNGFLAFIKKIFLAIKNAIKSLIRKIIEFFKSIFASNKKTVAEDSKKMEEISKDVEKAKKNTAAVASGAKAPSSKGSNGDSSSSGGSHHSSTGSSGNTSGEQSGDDRNSSSNTFTSTNSGSTSSSGDSGKNTSLVTANSRQGNQVRSTRPSYALTQTTSGGTSKRNSNNSHSDNDSSRKSASSGSSNTSASSKSKTGPAPDPKDYEYVVIKDYKYHGGHDMGSIVEYGRRIQTIVDNYISYKDKWIHDIPSATEASKNPQRYINTCDSMSENIKQSTHGLLDSIVVKYEDLVRKYAPEEIINGKYTAKELEAAYKTARRVMVAQENALTTIFKQTQSTIDSFQKGIEEMEKQLLRAADVDLSTEKGQTTAAARKVLVTITNSAKLFSTTMTTKITQLATSTVQVVNLNYGDTKKLYEYAANLYKARQAQYEHDAAAAS